MKEEQTNIMTNLDMLFKSVLEAEREAVVLCDLEHTIVYMNPAAKERYAQRGGDALVGKSLLDCHNEKSPAFIACLPSGFMPHDVSAATPATASDAPMNSLLSIQLQNYK